MRILIAIILLATLLTGCEVEDKDPPDYRAEYLGLWDVTEKTGINAPQIYSVQISAGNTKEEIIIKGLYNISGIEVQANINAFTITIPSQTTSGLSFSGSGSANVDFDQLNIDFTANDGSGVDQVNAVFTR